MADDSFLKSTLEHYSDLDNLFPSCQGTTFTAGSRSLTPWGLQDCYSFPSIPFSIPIFTYYFDKPNKAERKRLQKEAQLKRSKINFPVLKNHQYRMEWQDSEEQILCGSSVELHAASPSWTTITGTTPASLKCQAATIAPFMAVYHPDLFPRVRPGFDMYLQDSGVWWEPGAAMQFNAKVWLEFQPFLHDYQFNALRITDIGMVRFRKLANLARAGLARTSQVEHNPHAPTISLMATPKDASELLANFPTADSIIGQALWRVPFGCDYLLQVLVKLIQIVTLKDDLFSCVNQAPQYTQDHEYYDFQNQFSQD